MSAPLRSARLLHFVHRHLASQQGCAPQCAGNATLAPKAEPAIAISTTHVLRVSLKARLYREIEIESGASLHDLAESITSVFGFDFDHSFGFFSKLTGHIYQSPIRYELFADTDGGSSSRSVDRTTVKQAFPRIGSKMLFLFDYGDEWMFKVEVVRFGAKGPKVGYPRTISTVGMAPQQYPDFEDDD